jgi:heptosyltransferase-2
MNYYHKIIPIAERYLNAGKEAGITDDDMGLELFWNKNMEIFVKRTLNDNGISEKEKIFAIAPGAGFYTKRWPLEYYKTLIENILKYQQCKIVILGDENDKQQGTVLAECENVIDLTGHFSLLQSAVMISKCKALISNDSGLMHMATAVKTPVLAIFGSTVKEFGFFPYRSKSIVVENVGLKCRPCSHIGRHTCPQGHFKCMQELTPEIVMEKFGELLNQ